MTPESLLKAGVHAFQAGEAVRDGRIMDAVDHAVDLAMDLTSVEVLKQRIDDAAVRRANAIANLAESVKFPGQDGDP